MIPTSLSLLERLKEAGPGASDWSRLQAIYLPLIKRWLGRVPGIGHDVDDLAQDVFVVVIREIPRFQRRREGSFRAWLRQVTVNQVRTNQRRRRRYAHGAGPGPGAADGFLNNLADPNGDLAREWDADHDRCVFDQLLAIVRPDFSASTWDAFQRFAVDGLPANQVANELGLSVNAVVQAKSRVLKRLREEAGELLG